ncbi:MAG: hypothetical protein ACODAU_10585 [Myxococcota bacterium]
MLLASVVLFALAAVGGVVMSLKVVRGEPAPWPLSIGHGALAAAGLVTLLVAVVDTGFEGGPVVWSLILFLVAALGGFGLLALHVMGRTAPKGFVAGHGALAVVAFLLLLAGVLGT